MKINSSLQWLMPLLLAGLLQGCGGGDGSDSPAPPTTPAPTNLSYPAHPVFIKGTAITALSPTVTGSVTSYSISPALPAGLALNGSTGVISGTPTALEAATSHQVTASNAGGLVVAAVSITVNDIAPAITYPNSAYSFTTGVPLTPITPGSAGGAVVQWSVDHALPPGLTLNTATGVISGTPTQVATASAYIVTAMNSGGSTTFGLNIGVQTGVAFDLGHATRIEVIRHSGTRILSIENSGRVALWNAQTGALLRAVGPACGGNCGDLAALGGSTLAVRTTSGFDVYAADTGAPVAQIVSATAANTSWKLATDGSYIVVSGPTQLAAWSSAGASLLSRAGNYAAASVFAAPGEIRVAGGAAGAQVIETIALPGGAATSSPAFAGSFSAWFADGDRFLTHVGNTVQVYSKLAVQQDAAVLGSVEELAGNGNRYWTHTSSGDNRLRIYDVGTAGAAPTIYQLATTDLLCAGGSTLAILPSGPPSLSVIDLSGVTPVKTDYSSSIASLSAFGAASPSDWVVGNSSGVVLGDAISGPPVRYAHGAARSIAGSGSRVAVAVASGQILLFATDTRELVDQIDFASSKVMLSSDGSVLAAAASSADFQYTTDRTLRVYSLPSKAVIAEWPFTYSTSGQNPFDFTLSANGNVVGQVLGQFVAGGWEVTRRVMQVDSTPIWSEVMPGHPFPPDVPLRLSPSGARIAAPDDGDTETVASNLYSGATLTGTANGWSAGWIDESRLLVNRYQTMDPRKPHFTGADIVNPAGTVVATPAVIDLQDFQSLGSNLVYSPANNLILDVTTGDTVWSSAAPTIGITNSGAVGGGYVFFSSQSTIRAEPH